MHFSLAKNQTQNTKAPNMQSTRKNINFKARWGYLRVDPL